MPSDDEILTVKELCDLLRLHPTTVYKLVRQGKIPRFRVGNEWRFRRGVIERCTVEQSMNAQSTGKLAIGGGRPYVDQNAKAAKPVLTIASRGNFRYLRLKRLDSNKGFGSLEFSIVMTEVLRTASRIITLHPSTLIA
jgi:excisionase family DNA binding protein